MKAYFLSLLFFCATLAENNLFAQITYLNSVNSHSDNAIEMEISQDGRFSYVVSTHEIQVYQRNAVNGSLTFLSSVSQMQGGIQLYNISSLSMSQDEKFVYVIGSFKVFVFQRDSISGLVTPFQTLSDGNHQTSYPGNNNIVISKNNKNIYVAGGKNIYMYSRNLLTDSLSLFDTLQNVNGDQGLGFDISIVLSNDNKVLFATGGLSISVYSRDSITGELNFKNIITGTDFENQGLAYANESVSTANDRYIYTVSNSQGSGALVALKRDTLTDSLTIIQTVYNSIHPTYINRSWDNKLLCITGYDNFLGHTTIMFYEVNHATGMLTYVSSYFGDYIYDQKKCIDWSNRYMYACPYFTDSIYIHRFDVFINQSQYICNGEPTTLESWGNYNSYLWSTGSSASSITVNVPGDYYLTVQEANGNIYTDTVSVNVDTILPVSLGGDTVLYPGQAIWLDAGMNYANYSWNVSSTNSEYLFLQNDSSFYGTLMVTVDVFNSNGCGASDTILVTFSPGSAGIQIIDQENTSIYPNPFSSQAVLNTGNLSGDIVYTIFDLSGQIVKEEKHQNVKTIVVTRSGLSSGMYIIRVKNGSSFFIRKLLIVDSD